MNVAQGLCRLLGAAFAAALAAGSLQASLAVERDYPLELKVPPGYTPSDASRWDEQIYLLYYQKSKANYKKGPKGPFLLTCQS